MGLLVAAQAMEACVALLKAHTGASGSSSGGSDWEVVVGCAEAFGALAGAVGLEGGVPLLGESGRCIGVFQLINPHRADGAGTIGFEPGDIGVAARFAATVSMSVQRAQLTKSLIDRTIAMARLRDPSETGPHVQRVSRISRIIMEAWGARRGRGGSEWSETSTDSRLRPRCTTWARSACRTRCSRSRASSIPTSGR
jgi:hypothetical protein